MLEGAWLDEWAEQPRLTYVRNYIGSRHTPCMGPRGCTIMVKLRQMAHEHREPEHSQWDVSAANPAWGPCPVIPGRWLLAVYDSPLERVHFERWEPSACGAVELPPLGREVFVVEGGFVDELGEHRAWSWARNAAGGVAGVRVAGPRGCLLYVKSGHLQSPEVGVRQ